ncbi:MAG: patatin-like phospholipase family protein [Phycisphaeraceae bacterium]
MKRIISIDGGGVRGVFALQILREIEKLYREREGRRDLVLADVIDMFAGTSTGAIVAACLSWGMPVNEIEALYIKHGSEMFSRTPWWQRIRSKYRADPMANLFKEIFKEDDGKPAAIGSDKVRTRLLVVLRNATTGSPWPITNNPEAMYNDREHPECNLDLPLWRLLRASTAAPTFFTPESIPIGNQTFCFMDGGVSPYNNPALIAVLTATLPSYRMCWPTGRDKLHLVSVGTGLTRGKFKSSNPARATLLSMAGYVPTALMTSINVQQDMLCRVLGDCVHGETIDSEIGDLIGPGVLAPEDKWFTYARFNMRLEAKHHAEQIPPTIKARLDDLNLIPELQAIGKEYATEHVCPEIIGIK